MNKNDKGGVVAMESIEFDSPKYMEHNCVCFNLRKAARAITRIYDEMLRPAGLRVTQFTVLMVIRSLEAVTVKQLAQAMVMERTTLTRNLKLLAKQGLIQIEPGTDKRVKIVSLTNPGHKALVKAYPYWNEAQQKIIQSFGKQRLGRLLSHLSALVIIT